MRESGIKWKLKLPWSVAKGVVLDHQPAARVVGDCFFCCRQCSTVLRVAVGEEDTIQEGKGSCEASHLLHSIAHLLWDLGMRSGRQQAAELDQPSVS